MPVMMYYRSLLRSLTKDAKGIVAVSSAMLNWAIGYSKRTKTEKDKVFYIGFEQPSEERTLKIPEHFSESEPLTCVFFSTCGRSYDGFTLVRAAKLLEQSGDRRIRFIVTGEGEMRSKWMAEASSLSNVNFTGWISHREMQRYLTIAHVGLILMQGDITRFWLGNKFCEYLSASLALVNNVHGEPAEIINTNKIGENIPQQDPVALAAVLRKFADSPMQVNICMVKAKTIFFQMFERGSLYEKYVEYLRTYVDTGHGVVHNFQKRYP